MLNSRKKIKILLKQVTTTKILRSINPCVQRFFLYEEDLQAKGFDDILVDLL